MPGFHLLSGLLVVASRIAVFTWAGLRGGISIALALALSLGDSPYRDTLLLVTYVVVVFSVLVQGLTLKPLLVKLCPRLAAAEKAVNA